MKFNGVNHLAMATGDMDKTIRFWRDLLGMRLVAGLGQKGYRHYFFQISERVVYPGAGSELFHGKK